MLDWIDIKYNFKHCLHFLDFLVLSVAVRFTKLMCDRDVCVVLPNENGIHSVDEFFTLCWIVCLKQVHCEVLQTSCILKIPVPLLALFWRPCGITLRVLVDSYLRCRGSYLPNCISSRQRVFSMPNALRTSAAIQCYSHSCLPENRRSLLSFLTACCMKPSVKFILIFSAACYDTNTHGDAAGRNTISLVLSFIFQQAHNEVCRSCRSIHSPICVPLYISIISW